MYIDRIKKVLSHIMAEPERLIMGTAVRFAFNGKIEEEDTSDLSKPDFDIHFVVTPPCGTAACFGGWADIILNGTDPKHIRDYGWGNVRDRAQYALGLSYEEGKRLFHVRNWPSKYKRRYMKAKTSKTRARVLNDYVQKEFIAPAKEQA